MIKKNKRGAIGIIIFFSIMIIILIIGFGLTLVWSVVDIASDEITPVMEGLGMVGDVNVSQAAEYSFGQADNVVQALPLVIVFMYVMALIFTLVFVVVVGYNPHPAFISLYIGLMFLLILGCIVISNMYQDIISSDDDIGSRLREQSTMTFLLIHSPLINTAIAIIGGLLMFSYRSPYESQGGYGI